MFTKYEVPQKQTTSVVPLGKNGEKTGRANLFRMWLILESTTESAKVNGDGAYDFIKKFYKQIIGGYK